MNQQFNRYNDTANQHIDNPYGELTSSLIYPAHFQQHPHSAWPDPSGWQADGSDNHNTGNLYPGGMREPNSYFTEQQEYVGFDEGDDFYNNGDEITGTRPTGRPVARPGSTNPITASTQRGQMQRPSILSGTRTLQSYTPDQQYKQELKSHNVPQEDPSVMLGVLRAKLLAKKTAGGKTPTPEPKNEKANGSDECGKGNELSVNKENTNDTNSTTTKASNLPSSGTAKVTPQSNDKSVIDSKTASSRQLASGTDIEALFDEARAVEAAKKAKTTTNGNVQGPTSHVKEEASKPMFRPSTAITASRQAEIPFTSRRPSLATSMKSSETSEQGEIHEESKKADRSMEKQPPEPVLLNDSKGKPISITEAKYSQPPTKPSLAKPQSPKLDTTLATSRKGGSELDSSKLKSPSSARTPSISRLKEFRETLPPDSREEKHQDRNKPDRRQDDDWDRPRESYQRTDGFRPPVRYRAEEAERAAAEYKRNLRLAKAETRNVAPAPQPIEEPQILSNTGSVEQMDDVNEWLEMTGYFDKNYRGKALTRHRKLIELDRQRAELEREGQLEHEERLHMSRAQSIRPRESIESPFARSNITPRGRPSISMPPPPLPLKEVREDVGIQIKDLASRGNVMSNGRMEGDVRAQKGLSDSPVVLASAVKRQYPDDGYGSPPSHHAEKLARTDTRDYSFDKKTQSSPTAARLAPMSLESRISVENSPYKREYQARSKSPSSRRRSLTPPYRRTSGPEMALVRQHSSHSRSGYSPQRRSGMSRDGSPSRRDGGLTYDEPRDDSPHGRYNAYRSDYDNRSNSGYEGHQPSQRTGYYHNQQYQSPNYRGRGRGRGGRGGYYNHNHRGGYKTYDRGGSE